MTFDIEQLLDEFAMILELTKSLNVYIIELSIKLPDGNNIYFK